MPLENLERVVGIVFAAYGQDDAAAMQVQYCAVNFQVRVSRVLSSQLDSIEAVFADDPAPNRIVEIDHERLTYPAAQWKEEAKVLACQVDKGICAKRHAHGQPL